MALTNPISINTSIVLTWRDGALPATISGITAHSWVATADGLYTTTADLSSEWHAAYTAMLQGTGSTLTPLQRMEGNAEAVLENTKEVNQSTANQAIFRMDAQREFDAIWAAQQIDQQLYGINPNAPFNTYTYQQMQQTLQSNSSLEELGIQGHGLNGPVAPQYAGFTQDSQNSTDNTTYFVGGGLDNGQLAIASFFDDVILTHAPFPAVMQSGTLEQLNQNGNVETAISSVVPAANAIEYTRVLVAADFSTSPTATGPVVSITDPTPTPALPTAGSGQIVALDGAVISSTITITPHTWTANSTGLFTTTANLQAEWQTAYAAMLAGEADTLTPL